VPKAGFQRINENISDTLLHNSIDIPFGVLIHSGKINDAMHYGEYRNVLDYGKRFILIPASRTIPRVVTILTLIFALLAFIALMLLVWLRWSVKGKKVLKL
jgi:hypothetical protein